MELKSGYKQTEGGVIPEEWKVVPLSRTARRITRGASPRPIDSPLWFDEESGVGWVRISDVTRSHRYLEETAQRLSDAGIRNSRFVRSGGLIMSICATVGRPIETRIDACIHDGFVVFEQPQINQSFLYHALVDLEQTWFRRGQTGSQMNLNTGLINRRLVAIPRTEAEQRAIATALSDVDALLDGLERLIAKKRDLKQAAMQQLLTGQTRLPGFRGEWEVKRLGDVGTFLKGSGVKKDEAESGGLPCIRYGEIYTHHNDYIRIFKSWISPDVAATATRLRQGDLLFAGSGETKEEIGKCVAFVNDYEAFAGGDIVILRVANADAMFMGYYCNTAPINAQKASMGQGDAVVHIRAAALSRIEVTVPSAPEQTTIAAVLADMDTELSALEARRDKTRDLKKAMMQELLTGRTRLVAVGGASA